MRGHRLPFLLGGALARALLPATTVAVEPCTITGTAGGDRFAVRPYGPGVVSCGGAGDDVVDKLDGATFRGGDGHDRVSTLIRGIFMGGRARDGVRVMYGGTFKGGNHDDSVGWMHGGTFSGGAGRDRILCADSPPAVYDSVEVVETTPCPTEY